MMVSLHESIGLGSRELVSIVGAGGKTTALLTLGQELSSAGNKVILTTTTKMAPEQIADRVVWSADPDEVEPRLTPGTPLFVLYGRTPNRVTGPSADAIDAIYASTSADYVIVEADGARTKLIKAPADHEPVIPTTSTTVVVVVGANALGQRFASVAHRLDRIAALTGWQSDDVVTPAAAADILLHPKGGLKEIPDMARVVIAIASVDSSTSVDSSNTTAATELAALLERHPRIDRAVLLPSTSR